MPRGWRKSGWCPAPSEERLRDPRLLLGMQSANVGVKKEGFKEEKKGKKKEEKNKGKKQGKKKGEKKRGKKKRKKRDREGFLGFFWVFFYQI